MKNRLYFTSILVAATTAAGFLGCSSNSGGGAPVVGSSGSSSGGIGTGSSGGPGDAGSSSNSSGAGQSADAAACMPPSSVPSANVPPYVPVVGMKGACTSMQISGFISACVQQGVASHMSCEQWASSNGTCAACVVQGTDAGPAQTGAILFNVDSQGAMVPVSANVPGCIALEDTGGGPACAGALEPLMQCVAVACGMCTDQTSFTNCDTTAEASGGACASYAGNVQSQCPNDVGSSNDISVTKCGYGTPDELTDTINVICGTGP